MSRFPYPELYAVVGSRVPDYQGMFLRGVGGNAAAIGVQQGDAIRNITGTMSSYSQSIRGGQHLEFARSSGAFWRTYQSSALFGIGNSYSDEFYISGFDASRVVPTASENRPINKAVRYLIRAKT